MTDISKNIKKYRISKELSQTQLADIIGVSRQTISNWERGTALPDIQMLESLSKALGVEIEVLIYGFTTRKTRKKVFPLTPKFVFISVIVYFILFIPVGGFVGLPLLKMIVGGSVANDFTILIYRGLLLLVGYIAICTCLLSEYITDAYSDISSDEYANDTEDSEH